MIPQDLLESLGVLDWGYTEESSPLSFNHYEQWINEGRHGPLNYLSDHRKDLRSDIKDVFPEFQSALVFLFGYQETKKWLLENNQYELAAYTLGFGGEDYHYTLPRKLKMIEDHLRATHSELKTFICNDVQPILDRDLAHRAGLGWFGKNSMLIHRTHGSYFIIASLLLNKKLSLPSPVLDTDHCGQCRACIDACPTQAIDPVTRTLRAQDCISTFTIEMMKDAEKPAGMEKSRGEVFGCDICQDVCPWNRKPLGRVQSKFELQERFGFVKDWFFTSKDELRGRLEGESNRGFAKKMFGTCFDRPGRKGWLKNLK